MFLCSSIFSGIGRGCVSTFHFPRSVKDQLDMSRINDDRYCSIFTKLKISSNVSTVSMCACNVTRCNLGYDRNNASTEITALDMPLSVANEQIMANASKDHHQIEINIHLVPHKNGSDVEVPSGGSDWHYTPWLLMVSVIITLVSNAGSFFGRLGGNVGEWNFRKIEF